MSKIPQYILRQQFPILLLLVAILTSCSIIVRQAGGIKNAKVENRESIIAYLDELACPFEYTYILDSAKDSASIYSNMGLGITTSVLYDSLGNPLEYRKGIPMTGTNEECGGTKLSRVFEAPDSFYVSAQYDTVKLSEVLPTFKRIDTSKSDEVLPKADYYYVIYWCKYFGKKNHMKEELEWIESMRVNSKKKVVVLYVNTDMQESWGLNPGGKLKFKMQTRVKKGKWSLKMIGKEKNLWPEE